MAKTFTDWGVPDSRGNYNAYFDYFTQQTFGDDFNEANVKSLLAKADQYYVGKYDEYVNQARTGYETSPKGHKYSLGWEGYDPNDLSDAGLKKLEETYSKALGVTYGKSGYLGPNEFARLSAIGLDLFSARTQFNNQKMQGALADIETGKLKRKQFEQMRKIATEGNEEASEDQKPTGKASVLIGSNIPDRKQRRTSTSRDASTARAKVKVQAKGINI